MRNRLRFSTREQVFLFKQLALYTRSGLPLLHSLSYMHEQAPKAPGKRLLETLQHTVQNGQPLSHGLKQFPYLFSPLTTSFIEAGEASGSLGKTFAHISVSLDKSMALRRKILGACIYPFIVVTATLGIALFLTLYIFPRILPVLEGFHSRLPFPTRALLFIQNVLSTYWMHILLAILVLGGAGLFLLRKKRFRQYGEKLFLKVPLAGTFYRSYMLATLMHTLALLTDGGIRIVPALTLVQKGLGLSIYADAVEFVQQRVLEGQRLSQGFQTYPILFPSLVIQLLSVGENTGTLRENLHTLAELYAADLDDLTRNLSVLIEPALMIVLGLMVGFIALAIIAPMYQITGALSTN